ncbi:MAG: protease complex subunit PrcB family protein [Planctomycetes bacterium]|nr:protease complex subunit PrcB family protein [Planctomycetota bacterium]
MTKLILVLLLGGLGAGGVQLLDIPSNEPANEFVRLQGWVKKCEVEVKESAPPQFDLKLTVPMPTPGWELKVDEVTKPDGHGRIMVKLTGTPPEGVVAQVVTDTDLTASLGKKMANRYSVEIWYRKNTEKTYQLRDVILFDAR